MDNRIELLLQAVLSKETVQDVNKQVEEIQENINKISLDPSFVKALEKLEKIDLGNLSLGDLDKELSKAKKEIEDIKKTALSGADVKFRLDEKSLFNDLNSFQKEVERRGGTLKYDIDFKGNQQEITNLSASFEQFGKRTTEIFKKVSKDGEMVWDVSKIRNYETTVRDTTKAFEQVSNNLKKLGEEGKLSSQQIKQLTDSLQQAKGSHSEIKKVSDSMETLANSTANIQKLEHNLEKLRIQGKISADDYTNQMQRIQKAGTISTGDYKEISRELEILVLKHKEYSRAVQDAEKKAAEASKEQERMAQAYNKVNETLRKLGSEGKLTGEQLKTLTNTLENFKGSHEDLKRLEESMHSLAKSTTNIEKLEHQLIKLKEQGKITATEYEQQMQRIQKAGNINSADYTAINRDLELLALRNREVQKEAKETERKTQEASRNMANSAVNIEKLHHQLEKLKVQGKITANDYEQYMKKIEKSSKIDSQDYQRINRELDLLVTKNKEYARAVEMAEKKARESAKEQERLAKEKARVHAQALKEEAKEVRALEKAQEKLIDLQNKLLKASNYTPKIKADENYNQLVDNINKLNFNKATMSAADLDREVRRASQSLDTMTAKVTEAGRTQIGFIDSFKIAMEKFPVWMAASTAFYGTVRSAREFMSIIVDIDTKMTSLRKVVADGTDMEEMFDRATLSAEKFGQTISDTLDAYIEFSKQGFEGKDLGFLADASVVMGNVADMEMQTAAEFLTSSIIQWNKEASEAMDIADKWNEISNTQATTTLNLAQGQARAASVAKTMGMDFEELNGIIAVTTAMTKQSGNEIGNFIKSVLPRLTSAPAAKALKMVNVELLDQQGNLRNIIDIYKEVAVNMKTLNSEQQTMVLEGLAGKYHISRISALLDDLGRVDSMYDQVMKSQAEASGSAIEENEEYLKSLEARMAKARRAIEELALGLGDAFLTDSMIAGIEGFAKSLEHLTKWIEKTGALAPMFGILGGAIFALSGRVKGMAEALVFGTSKTSAATLEIAGLEKGMTRGASAAKLFSNSLKTIGLGLGFTAVLTVAGIVIEKFIGQIGESRQRAEEFNNTMKESALSYKDNSEEITRLSEKYSELESAMKDTTLTAEERTNIAKELKGTQEELSTLMPTLKVGEDEYGNAIYKTSGQTEQYITLLQQRIDLEEKRQEIENRETRRDFLEDNLKSEKERLKEVKALFTELQEYVALQQTNPNAFTRELFGEFAIEEIDDVREALIRLKEVRDELQAEGDERGVDALDGYIQNFENILNAYEMVSIETQEARLAVAEIFDGILRENIEDTIKLTEHGEKLLGVVSGIVTASEMKQEEVQKLYRGVQSGLSSDGELNKIATEYQAFMNRIEKIRESSKAGEIIDIKELENNVSEAKKLAQQFSNEIVAILKDIGMTDLEIEDLSPQINAMVDSLSESEGKLADLGNTTEDTTVKLKDIEFAFDDVGDSADDATTGVDNLDDAIANLTGTTFEQIDAIYELLDEMEQLLNLKNGLTEGTEELAYVEGLLIAKEEELLNLLPHLREQKELLGLTTLEIIEYAGLEAQYADIVQSAYHDLSNGMIDANGKRVISSNETTKAILHNLALEQEAFGQRQKNLNKIKFSGQGADTAITAEFRAGQEQLTREIEQTTAKSAAEIRNLMNQTISSVGGGKSSPTYSNRQSSRTGSSGGSGKRGSSGSKRAPKKSSGGSKGTKANTKAKKDNAKATEAQAKAEERAAFIADEYKRAVEGLTLALKEQQAIKGRFPAHSKEHQDALKKEIELEKKRLELMQKQTKELKQNLKEGKVPQSGVVAEEQQVTTTTTPLQTSRRKLSGWQARVNSGYGWRFHPIEKRQKFHEGVDIAQPLGTRLESNIKGIVEKAFHHGGYGNVVFVRDAQGRSHRYAHLNKIAVKAGQQVDVGTHLGDIGRTGNSTGPHLHYEIRVNGKPINPMQWVNAAKGMQDVVVGGGTTVKNVSGVSKDVANAANSLFDLESNILDLQGQIIDQQIKIEQLQAEMIRAELAYYEHRKSDYDYHLAYEGSKYEMLEKTSERYLHVLQRQNMFMGYKQDMNRKELAHLKELIDSGKLQGNVLEEVRQRYKELTISMNELALEIANIRKLQIDAKIEKWGRLVADLDYELAKLDQTISYNTEGSVAWLEAMEERSDYLASKRSAIKQEIDQLTMLLRTTNMLTPDTVDEYKQRLQELTLQYRELGISLDEIEKMTKDAEKNAWEDIANNIIQAYKDAISEKRDMHIKSIDEEMERENKRHDKVMENLNKELELFREQVDLKLKLLQKEDRDRDFEQEMDALYDERAEIVRQIDILSMDDSREAKYKRKKLLDDLTKLDKTIENKNYKREKELREEAINDSLRDKEKEIQEKERLEDEKHEKEKKRIDDLREYWEMYYTDLLNDERKFAQMREDIMNQNFENIEAEFQDLIQLLTETMPELENDLNGTMEAVGTAIRQNIIDNLNTALEKMYEFQSAMNAGSGGGSASKPDLSTGLTPPAIEEPRMYGDEDFQVGIGKLIRHDLARVGKTQAEVQRLKDIGSDLADQGRSQGSSIDNRIRYAQMVEDMSKADVLAFADAIEAFAPSLDEKDFELQDLLRKEANRLRTSASFDTGGYTGSWGSSGRVALLHEKELVLNKKETDRFGNLIASFNGMQRLFGALQRGSTNTTNSLGDNILTVNIENLQASEEEARKLTDIINREWAREFKVERGMR